MFNLIAYKAIDVGNFPSVRFTSVQDRSWVCGSSQFFYSNLIDKSLPSKPFAMTIMLFLCVPSGIKISIGAV